ncbi:MAG: ATP-binding cassette domain-containing protein [Candidatus Planktophila sp.]
MSTLVSVQRLTITLGNRTLLSDLSFEIEQGQTLGLIGESGSGKSLTALAILGLLPPEMKVNGQIIFSIPGEKSVSITASSERELQAIRGRYAAIVFQEPQVALNPLMRVEKQISRASRDADIDSLLNQVALTDTARIRKSYPFELSGGERQRVAIALALSKNPFLLIADEPTTALDVTIQSEVLELLRNLARERSLLFISHDLPVVASMSKDVRVLHQGQLVATGSISELAKATDNDYVKDLFESAYYLDGTLNHG